jgi:hypothetical protein
MLLKVMLPLFKLLLVKKNHQILLVLNMIMEITFASESLLCKLI